MKKYFVIQLKRLLRIFPPILIVTAILFGCLAVVYDAIVSLEEEEGRQGKFRVGIVGTAGDTFLKMGLAAVESFDSTRYSVEFIEMTESDAEAAMRKGAISAFIVIPENFLDEAMYGNIIPLKYVCAAGALGLVSMVKDEISQLVEVMLIESQKGIYGAGNALNANGLNGSQIVGEISLEYVDLVFARSRMYRVTEMKKFDGLGMSGYMLSGLCVVLFSLVCLTFAPVMIRADQSLARVLAARRRPAIAQVLCDFLVYMVGLLGIVALVWFLAVTKVGHQLQMNVIFQCVPALFAVGAMSFLLYELASDLISGVLLQFFVTLALCFVSGCLYPITFFPDSIQKLSNALPTGLARQQLSNCILSKYSMENTLALIGFGCTFLAVAILIRRIKVSGVRG